MFGYLVTFVGVACVVAALTWLYGPFALGAGGLVLLMVGLLVDLDPVKEPQRGKRSQSAP